MSRWYGKIIFSNEGVYTYADCETEAEAQSFVNGFLTAKEITNDEDEDWLEEYTTAVDQIEPVEE